MLLKNVDVIILCHSLISMRKAGPHRIATELRKHGYTCQIIDAAWYFDQQEIATVLNHCVGPSTKVVAWSSTYAQNQHLEQHGVGIVESLPIYHNEVWISQHVKTINPAVKIAIGGPNSWRREHEPGVDVVFYGMCDQAIVQYMKFLQGQNPFFQYSVNQTCMIVKGDTYNIDWDFNQSTIAYQPEDNVFRGDSVTIETARGCIFRCDFCSYPLNGKKSNEYIKYKSILYQEFLDNYQQWGIDTYIVSDDTFNDNIEKMTMLAEIAQKLPFELRLTCYMRIDLIRAHQEQYSLIKDIGIVGAFFGIESLNHQSLKVIGKGLHPDRVIEELYRFNEKLPDCGTIGSFIAGLPFETIDSLETTKHKLLAHDFPLDALRFQPLVLDFNRRHNLSEFEKNTAKYFTTDSNISAQWWHNGHFDFDYAQTFCRNFLIDVGKTQRHRIGGFQVAAFKNFYPDTMLAKQPIYDWPVSYDMQLTKLNTYKNKIFDSINSVSQ